MESTQFVAWQAWKIVEKIANTCTQQAGARINLMRQINWLLKRCSEVKGTLERSGSRKANHGRLRHAHKLICGGFLAECLCDCAEEEFADLKKLTWLPTAH